MTFLIDLKLKWKIFKLERTIRKIEREIRMK